MCDVALGRVLRHAVVRDGNARDVLGRRDEVGLAVGGHRARVHEPRHTRLDAAAQHVHRSDDVRPQIDLGLGEREPDARLSGDVEHRVEALVREELVDERPIADVALDEGRAGGDVLARRPVERLSSTVTSKPSASSRSVRCEPMNPAPPVTRHVLTAAGATSSPRMSSSVTRDVPRRVVASAAGGGR